MIAKAKFIFTVLFSTLTFLCFAQTSTATPDSVTITKDGEALVLADEMPEYPGGMAELYKFLATNIKYPREEKETGKQGTVYIQFIIEKDGSVTNIVAVKEVPGAPGLTAEAIRVYKLMPKWKPGKMNGEVARVQMTQPVKFVLQEDAPKEKKKKH